ncbi:MAG TPA: hypothetical protein VN420_05070 [Candidatus Fimivivens sp.]|nr:hypothetical protein [Candidatus Fimivivens sp.]
MDLKSAVFDRLFLPESFINANKDQMYDFMVANAFGRNSFTDKEASTIIRQKRDELDDDIAMFEWLQTENFDPGSPNILLATELSKHPSAFDIPVIGQWEIMYELWKRYPGRYNRCIDTLFAIWPPKKGYLRTRGFMLEAKRIAELRRLRIPCVTAHPEHIQRCFFMARNVFGSAISKSLSITPDWFDKRSVQKWTRGKWSWLTYELMVRIHHRILGWM